MISMRIPRTEQSLENYQEESPERSPSFGFRFVTDRPYTLLGGAPHNPDPFFFLHKRLNLFNPGAPGGGVENLGRGIF